MSELLEIPIEDTGTVEDAILSGLQEILDAPPVSQTEFQETDYQPRRKRRRQRSGENIRPTPLQMRYQRQVRDGRQNRPDITDRMSNLVAWTWIPGKDRRNCPPIVDLRDPRLLVMDRFPAESCGTAAQIGLTMYRSAITNQGSVLYGCPENVEMFKDFSIRPHFRAGGLCLDSRNEEVLRTALALDQAIELVAREKLEPIQDFSPPPCLYGFPKHYIPVPEWRAPLQDEVRKVLNPNSPVLRCLLSPGGTITGVQDTRDGFRTINVEQEGNLIHVRVPNWVILNEAVKIGSVVHVDQPLGDLPRGEFATIKEVTQRYPFKSLEWLERRLLDEMTEIISIQEEIFDHQTKMRIPATTTWRCVPARYVQNQVGRAARFFLDFRQHLGRKSHMIDSFECDQWKEEPQQVRVDVCRFNNQPSVSDLMFTDEKDGRNGSWYADLLATPESAPWAYRCQHRGIAHAA